MGRNGDFLMSAYYGERIRKWKNVIVILRGIERYLFVCGINRNDKVFIRRWKVKLFRMEFWIMFCCKIYEGKRRVKIWIDFKFMFYLIFYDIEICRSGG